MLTSRHIADSYIYATHTLLICEIEDKEEGESSRNYMYISILHPFLCSSCKYFKQNKCVKMEKQPSERAVFPFTFMEPHRPLCQVGTTRPMVALVKFPTDKDRPGNV